MQFHMIMNQQEPAETVSSPSEPSSKPLSGSAKNKRMKSSGKNKTGK